MSCTILVFVKQVPDTKNVTGDAMKPDGTINRQALPAIFNPEDLNALELALQLKDRYGAKVIVATMGLPAAAGILRDSLFRGADDTVLLVDDFLANGAALRGLVELCRQAGACVAGAAIAIEKAFQGGGDALRAAGVRVESLAVIERMDGDKITFRR